LDALRLNQSEAASKLGMSQAVVSMWLKGTRVPPKRTIEFISTRLGISVDELTGQPAGAVVREPPVVFCSHCAALERENRELRRQLTAFKSLADKLPKP